MGIKRRVRGYMSELRQFGGAWYRYMFWKGYGWFARFERIKKWIAGTLYRQRGRFARPFAHTAMGGLVAMGVTLAPVLAQSLPGRGIEISEAQTAVSVMEIEVDSTETKVSDKVRDKVLEYVVLPGDTVSAIAGKFGVSVDTIRWENNLASLSAIKPGQILRILPVTGVRHKVGRGETIYSIAKKYGANSQAMVDFPFNNFLDNETFSLAVGQDLIVPEGEKPNVVPWSPTRYVAQRTPDAGKVSALGAFVWPIGGVITQRFVWYHQGLDIATAMGTPILAADAGRVRVSGWVDNAGYGNRVEIDHGNGYVTRYAHMSRIDVVVGQNVNRGDRIGLEGSTGRSTGPHLHFEIIKGGVRVNPLDYLR